MPSRTNRQSDERLLVWLRLRTDGLTSEEIGERFGIYGNHVRVATNRVKQADIAESGEDVRGFYW